MRCNHHPALRLVNLRFSCFLFTELHVLYELSVLDTVPLFLSIFGLDCFSTERILSCEANLSIVRHVKLKSNARATFASAKKSIDFVFAFLLTLDRIFSPQNNSLCPKELAKR